MSDASAPDGAASLYVVAWTDDLFLATRLQDAVRRAGGRWLLVDRPEVLGAAGAPSPRSLPLTEPLDGPDAAMLRRLVDDRPSLLLVDTGSSLLPWERWIQVLKTSAATRRIPIVAFGPHVERRALDLARQLGADQAISRGALGPWLREYLIEEAARKRDMNAGLGCDRDLSDAARRGIRLVEAGEYFEAHEAFEQAWMSETGLAGDLYRVLVQVAVLYLQITRRNYRGAVKMLLRVRQWLDPLPAACRGVDLDSLRTALEALRRALEAGGAEGIERLDRSLLQPIRYVAMGS